MSINSQSTLSKPRTIGGKDNSVCQSDFTLNSCDGIHIGTKYENSNNIIINQNVTLQNEEQVSQNIQLALKDGLALKEVLENPGHDPEFMGLLKNCCKLLNPISIGTFSLTLILTALIILKFGLDNNAENTTKQGYHIPNQPVKDSLEYPIDLRFVQRESWRAAQPLSLPRNNTLPLHRVTFIHTASSSTCNRYDACVQKMLEFQEQHMEWDFGDIGYNFVIGSDGYIYVGVGWDKVGAHTCDGDQCYNTGYLGVAFIGDFRKDEPNEHMTSSAKRLLEYGVKLGKLSQDYQLFGHCQVTTSFPLSPGKNIMNLIKQWNYWNNTKVNQCKG